MAFSQETHGVIDAHLALYFIGWLHELFDS